MVGPASERGGSLTLMVKGIKNLIDILTRMGISPLRVAMLVALSMCTVVLEGIGVAILLPIFEIFQAGDAASIDTLQGRHWEILRAAAGFFGVKITLGLLLAVSFAFIVARQAVNYLNERQQNRVRRTAADRVRRRAFNAFLRADTGIQDRSRIGEMAAGLTVEVNNAMSALFGIVGNIGRLLQVVVYTAGLFLVSWPMTLLAIFAIGIAGYLMRGLLLEVKRAGKAITKANINLSSFMIERLRHVRLIRLSGTEKAEANAFAKLSHEEARQALHQSMISARLWLLPEPMALGFAYSVLFIGGQVFGLGLDRLGIFVVVLLRLMPTVRGLISDYNNILGKWPSVAKVNDLLLTIGNAREAPGGDIRFTGLHTAITYDNVYFNYAGGDTPALQGVSVRLPAHRMTGLVGPSGAGKSTFIDLLPRLRQPTSGEIRFDDTSIQDFTTESLRAGIAFVPQEPQIFNITAAEHIRYGKEDATDEEVREAARLAGALGFIESLPQGFNTLLADGGKRLSGGQRQRIDIARALVRRAPILILDEPTSALDADAEAAFRDALQSLRRETDLTIIVIAHRLSTIADADQIVVLNKGKVEAIGRHAELVNGNNWYARAFKKQHAAHSIWPAELAGNIR
jgi:subfamily B ATP-binding cassette protein MsbA